MPNKKQNREVRLREKRARDNAAKLERYKKPSGKSSYAMKLEVRRIEAARLASPKPVNRPQGNSDEHDDEDRRPEQNLTAGAFTVAPFANQRPSTRPLRDGHPFGSAKWFGIRPFGNTAAYG